MKSKRPYAVYRMFSVDGKLLYIGCTSKIFARLKSHEDMHVWATDIAQISVEWLADKNDALAAEKTAIENEGPEWNLLYNAITKRAKCRKNPTANWMDGTTWIE
jgi:excinuclease UvrABC nuclease subunit